MKKFMNKFLWWGLAGIIVEQLLVAFSTFCIAQIGLIINDFHVNTFLIWTGLFIFALICAFLPTMFVAVMQVKCGRLTYQHYINYYNSNLFNHPYLLTNRRFGTRYGFLANQMWEVIDETLIYLKDLWTIILNLIFNLIVVAVVITPFLLGAYALSFLLVFVCIFFTHKKTASIFNDVQIARTNINNLLPAGWTTILIGNFININLWIKEFKLLNSKSKHLEVKQQVLIGLILFCCLFISFVPIIACTVIFLYLHDWNMALILIVCFTLPRQVTMLQYLSALIQALISFSGNLRKVKNLDENALVPVNVKQYKGTINWPKISIKVNDKIYQFPNLSTCLDFLKQNTNGRWTVTGDNGVGKTNILTELKAKLNGSYYYPVIKNLYFDTKKDLSTGQLVKTNLRYVFDQLDENNIKYLLLDEWNANLDKESQAEIDKAITNVAQKIIVIEIKHKE